jgi:hypothetical protein
MMSLTTTTTTTPTTTTTTTQTDRKLRRGTEASSVALSLFMR